MRPLLRFTPLRPLLQAQPRLQITQLARFNSTNAAPQPPSRHRTFYHLYGRPILKVFLLSYFFYQAAYWVWLKLEYSEAERKQAKEIEEVEGELARAIKKQQEEKEKGGK